MPRRPRPPAHQSTFFLDHLESVVSGTQLGDLDVTTCALDRAPWQRGSSSDFYFHQLQLIVELQKGKVVFFVLQRVVEQVISCLQVSSDQNPRYDSESLVCGPRPREYVISFVFCSSPESQAGLASAFVILARRVL